MNSILNPFLSNFHVESYYLDHSLFTSSFFIYQNSLFFSIVFFSTHSFYSKQNHFFHHFYSAFQNIFLKKMNKTLIFQFFDFFLQIKYHLFFEIETKSKTLFLCIFGNSNFNQVKIIFFKILIKS